MIEIGGRQAQAHIGQEVPADGRTTGTTIAFLAVDLCDGSGTRKDDLRIKQLDEILAETASARSGIEAHRLRQNRHLTRNSLRVAGHKETPRSQDIGSCTLGVDVQFDHVFCVGNFGVTSTEFSKTQLQSLSMCEFVKSTSSESKGPAVLPIIMWRSQPQLSSSLAEVSYANVASLQPGIRATHATFELKPTPSIQLLRREAILEFSGLKFERMSVHLPGPKFNLSPRARLHCKFFSNPPGLLRSTGDHKAPRSELVVSDYIRSPGIGDKTKWVWHTEQIRDLMIKIPAHQSHKLDNALLYIAFFEGDGSEARFLGHVHLPLGRPPSADKNDAQYTIDCADTLQTELGPIIKRGSVDKNYPGYVNCTATIGKYQAIHVADEDPTTSKQAENREAREKKRALLAAYPWLVRFSDDFDKGRQRRDTRHGHEKNFWRLLGLLLVFLWLFLGCIFYRHSSGFTIPQAFCELFWLDCSDTYDVLVLILLNFRPWTFQITVFSPDFRLVLARRA